MLAVPTPGMQQTTVHTKTPTTLLQLVSTPQYLSAVCVTVRQQSVWLTEQPAHVVRHKHGLVQAPCTACYMCSACCERTHLPLPSVWHGMTQVKLLMAPALPCCPCPPPPSPQPREMTVATVDKVLDEVRPVLMADGGDVEVRRGGPGPAHTGPGGASQQRQQQNKGAGLTQQLCSLPLRLRMNCSSRQTSASCPGGPALLLHPMALTHPGNHDTQSS